jgi:hypothetical protein
LLPIGSNFEESPYLLSVSIYEGLVGRVYMAFSVWNPPTLINGFRAVQVDLHQHACARFNSWVLSESGHNNFMHNFLSQGQLTGIDFICSIAGAEATLELGYGNALDVMPKNAHSATNHRATIQKIIHELIFIGQWLGQHRENASYPATLCRRNRLSPLR